MIKLRPAQLTARQEVISNWDAGNLDTLLAMATGTGKTECYLATLAADMKPGDRALVIAHRQELIYQPKDRILRHWVDELGRPGIVMAQENEYAARIVIATIQTLSSNGRLDQILSAGKVTHLITDEAHHATAATYRELYRRMREHNPHLKHLGVTATPKRTDGEPLADIFDTVAFRLSIKDAIKMGALCPFTAMGFQLPVSIADVPEVGEGWDDEILGDVLKADNAEELIIEKWKEYAEDRPTICFTASVAQAYSLAERFREHGYAFEAADGTTSNTTRQDILRRFQSGELQGVVNCALWTEGFDAPQISCLVQVRPTRSDLVYAQMAGRAFRVYPSKKEALILDFVPMDARDLRLAGDLLGKPKEQAEREEKAIKQGVVLSCFGIDSEGNGIDGDPDEIVMKILDYLHASSLIWTFDGELATAIIGENCLAVVSPDETAAGRVAHADKMRAEGSWLNDWQVEYDRLTRQASYRLYLVERYTKTFIASAETWDDIAAEAENYADTHEQNILGKKRAVWRKNRPSDKQRALCMRLGIWQDNMNRGTAAQAITHFFARKTLGL